MNKIGAFFRLVRWQNLFITALMMCLVYHCVIMQTSTLAFTLLVIAMTLIVAGGYVINDIFDKEIDAVNKPERVIVGKIFSEKQCGIFYWALTIMGLGCGLMAGILAHGKNFYTIFASLLLLACFLYSYSSRYKKKLIVGNVIVSLSVAFAVFLPWLFQILSMLVNKEMLLEHQEWMRVTLHIVLIYVAFAFLMTLIREIVKDMEDVEGDMRLNCRTIPIAWGLKAAQVIVLVLSLLTFTMSIYAKQFLCDYGFNIAGYLLNGASIFMFVMMFGNVFGLLDASFRTSKQFHMQSIALKISMLIGVLSIFFIK